MKELLTDLLEYMEQRADADGSSDGFTPNKEMGFQIRIEEALAELSTEGLKLSDDLVVKSLAAIHKSEQELPAPNTVMWWLCRIADPEIRRKAVVTFDKFPLWDESNKLKMDSIEKAIVSIDWYNEDNENGTYFEGLYKQVIPLLPEPDFTEYLEIRK